MTPPRCTCTPGSTDGGIIQDPEWDLDCPVHAAAIEAEFGSQPPCTCGKTATGLVVEGHLHPYCAWQAERERAEALDAEFMQASFVLDGVMRFVSGLKDAVRDLGSPDLAARCEALEESFDAVLAEHSRDREGRS